MVLTSFHYGIDNGETVYGDFILDEIKTFSEAVLPYGAYFIGNGEVDTAVAHADIQAFIKGDESTTDSLKIGTGTITITGATKTTDVEGNANSAILFDASNEVASINYQNIDFTIGAIAFWFKSNDTSPPLNAVFFEHTTYTNFSVSRSASNTSLEFYLNSSSIFLTVPDLWDQRWHWIKFIWNDTDNIRAVDIDGIRADTDTTAFSDPSIASGILRIGGDGSTNFIDGTICNFYITNNPNTPEIWTAFGKPLHQPLIIEG
jgi:hypothetical protein